MENRIVIYIHFTVMVFEKACIQLFLPVMGNLVRYVGLSRRRWITSQVE